jgi:transposase InsO family protein
MIEDFRSIHNDQSGHHGLEFSYRKLLKECGSKWANERGEATKIKEQLRQYIDGCPTCQKLRGLRDKIKCKHSFIVSRPFLEVSYDFIIFKRPDSKGNRYLLVAIDNFSKLVEMKAVPTREAETVAQFLLEIAARYGHCARLRSDREAAFMGQIISQLNANRGTETKPCIAYRPQANSICERQNAIVTFHLTALIMGCNLGPKDKVAWSDLIPEVFSIVNNTPKNPLGISPLSLVYGVFANYDRPLLSPVAANAIGETSNPVDYVESLIQWQMRLLEITEDIQNQHFQKMEKRFNSKETPRKFNEGDFVLQRKDATGISGKPNCRWIGPFLVMNRRDNDPTHPVLDLMNLTDLKVKEAAADDCRKFNTSWFEEKNMIPELTKIAAADLDEYVVEKILAHRPEGEYRTQPLSKYFFLVKWEDFEEPTWEPYSGICKLEPLDVYSDEHPDLKIPKSSSA